VDTSSIDHPQSVTATLSLAFERVTQIQPTIMELLYLFAFLHPDTISDEMLQQGAPVLEAPLQQLVADSLKFDMALENLLNFSLVHRHADTTTLSIHRIVQAVLKDQLSQEQQRSVGNRGSTPGQPRLPRCPFQQLGHLPSIPYSGSAMRRIY